jgi:phospholipase C
MVDQTRRRLMQGAAAAAALSALPRFSRGQVRNARLTDIDHIIVLMKENRSFDHYFGSLAGVRGFDDAHVAFVNGRSVFHQPDSESPDGYVLPFHLDTRRTRAQLLRPLSHAWKVLHACRNGGRMDGWIPAHRAVNGDLAPLTMGYFTRNDLPFYYALADAFTICDGYHASVMGPTHPNRYYLMTASIDPLGKNGGPALNNSGRRYRWETYPERLERAGISWRIYHEKNDYNCNVCKFFVQYHSAPRTSPLYESALRNRPFSELLRDFKTGDIPQVTWIVPPSTLSEHPDFLPAAGENHTRQILEALWSNPGLWARTAVVLNYDENDGLFDHVLPPVPAPGTPDEFVGGLPIGLGFRVPCLIISPFSRGGYVCGATFDHTSVLRLIETRFGVEVANLSPWRRKTCGDLTAAFAFDAPARSDVPNLPETLHALEVARKNVATLPPPTLPDRPEMPRQEPGVRPRRA